MEAEFVDQPPTGKQWQYEPGWARTRMAMDPHAQYSIAQRVHDTDGVPTDTVSLNELESVPDVARPLEASSRGLKRINSVCQF